MDNQTDGQITEEDIGGALSTISDTIGDLVTGIPAPIRKNAVRAFTRLCTAAVEYPAALIETAITERRAESLARVKLINTSAEQIAQQMQTSPEYARAAAKKFSQKISRERINIDQIAQITAGELRRKSAKNTTETPDSVPIREDWMSVFENEAAQMSSEEMQRLFARILAGEIRKPSSYSIRTVRILAQIDNTAAALFQKFCSLCISSVSRCECARGRQGSLDGECWQQLLASLWSVFRPTQCFARIWADHFGLQLVEGLSAVCLNRAARCRCSRVI